MTLYEASKKAGLIGCLDGTGVTSENYREKMFESNWVSVKDRLPDTDSLVVIWNEKRPCNYLIAIYSAYDKEFMHYEYAKVLTWPVEISHWLPLPKVPNE
jgi:hypothetical protein